MYVLYILSVLNMHCRNFVSGGNLQMRFQLHISLCTDMPNAFCFVFLDAVWNSTLHLMMFRILVQSHIVVNKSP